MNKMKYPIDCKKNQYAFGYWQGRMLGLLEACINASILSVEAAKSAFSVGFEGLFPPGNITLNSIRVRDLIINLDEQKEDQVWRSYSRLLELWMNLEEETLQETLNGVVDETDLVSEQHFVNILRLSKFNLEQLHK